VHIFLERKNILPNRRWREKNGHWLLTREKVSVYRAYVYYRILTFPGSGCLANIIVPLPGNDLVSRQVHFL
jgi:hypothetical protein